MNNKLSIIFMGTPDFAVPSLDILVKNGYAIKAVITAPDRPAGRGQKLRPSPVKKYAVDNDLKVLQPTNLKDEGFLKELRSLKADLQVVVAFRMLPEAVWDMPPKGTFNLHASLLPQYRGAAPINWAIINGEKETGVTTFFLQHEIDTGNIIFQEKTPIGENETAGEVHDRLMEIGSRLVLKTVQAIEKDDYELTSQESLVSDDELKSAPKIFKDDCRIDWQQDLASVHNFIRGLSPYPTAFTKLVSPDGEKHPLKIFRTLKEEGVHSSPPGSILTDGQKEMKVAVKNGYLIIKELQLAGKKIMKTKDFLNGFALNNEWQCE